MSPRKLVVGNVPRKVQPPATVRPPTATGGLTEFRQAATSDSNNSTEHQLNMPPVLNAGDLLLFAVSMRLTGAGGDPIINEPSGWSMLAEGGPAGFSPWVAVMYKVADGTETDTTYTTTNGIANQGSAGVTLALPSPGGDHTFVLDTNAFFEEDVNASGNLSFSALSPTSGNGDYKVVQIAFSQEGSSTDLDFSAYGDATFVAEYQPGATFPVVKIAAVDQDITDSYTPSDWTTSGGSQPTVVLSLAVGINGVAASVAAADHTHPASEVTSRYEVLVVDNGGTLEALETDDGLDWLYVEVT